MRGVGCGGELGDVERDLSVSQGFPSRPNELRSFGLRARSCPWETLKSLSTLIVVLALLLLRFAFEFLSFICKHTPGERVSCERGVTLCF